MSLDTPSTFCINDQFSRWDINITLTTNKVIELVNSIPFNQRHTTVVIERKEDKIAQIAERVEKCQTYYASIVEEFMNRTNK